MNSASLILQLCVKRILNLKAVIILQCDSEDDDSELSGEETALESFTTPLDDDESPVDEYIIFKDVMLSKFKLIVIRSLLASAV